MRKTVPEIGFNVKLKLVISMKSSVRSNTSSVIRQVHSHATSWNSRNSQQA